MTPRTGRPIEGQSRKDVKVQIRVDKETLAIIDALAMDLDTTRTGVIMKGIELVKESIKK